MSRPTFLIYDSSTGNTLVLDAGPPTRLAIEHDGDDSPVAIELHDQHVEDLIIELGGLPPHPPKA